MKVRDVISKREALEAMPLPFTGPARDYLGVAMRTTGPMVAVLVGHAEIPEARRLAIEYAKQGLRAARLLGLYLDDEDALMPRDRR